MKLSDRLRLEADDALAQGARNLARRLSEMADEAVSLEECCASGSSATRGAGRNTARRNGRRGAMNTSEPRFFVGQTWLTRAEYDALPADSGGWRMTACGARTLIAPTAHVGDGASVGDRAHVGDLASVGDRANVGGGTRVGNRANVGGGTRVGNGTHVGDWARVGSGARVGDEAHVGNGTHVGNGARGVLCDLGREQGRGFARLAYIARDGSVRVTAGCRDFSISEAREHWGSPDYEGGPKIAADYLAMIDYVERVAELRKDEIAAMIAQGGGGDEAE